MPDRLFPIMDGPAIPWFVIEPCERQADRNHGQTLKRLAERGGLDVGEAIAVLTSKSWRDIPRNATPDDLLRIVAERIRLMTPPNRATVEACLAIVNAQAEADSKITDIDPAHRLLCVGTARQIGRDIQALLQA